MLVPIERFINLPVLSLQTGAELARTGEPIVDPRQLKIAAFWVSGRRLDHEKSVLHPTDIREISDIGLIVNSSDQLMSVEGLVRLQTILDYHFTLIGIRVEDEHKRRIGTVKTYSVDPESFFIQQLYIKPPLLKQLGVTNLTVHRNQIVSVKNDVITVASGTAPKKSLEKTMKETFVNPFRSPAPTQPETKNFS